MQEMFDSLGEQIGTKEYMPSLFNGAKETIQNLY